MPAAIWSLQGGDADLEELVEVGRGDGAELGPLEQRDAGLLGQPQHPAVEVEPAQLTVDGSRSSVHRSVIAVPAATRSTSLEPSGRPSSHSIEITRARRRG